MNKENVITLDNPVKRGEQVIAWVRRFLDESLRDAARCQSGCGREL